MSFFNKKILNFFKKIKNDITQKINQTDSINEFSNSHFLNNNIDKIKLLSISMLTLSLVLGLFIYSYIYIKNKIQERDISSSMGDLKIIIPHPNSDINFENIKNTQYKIQAGDNLANILIKTGLTNNDTYDILVSLQTQYNVRSLRAGQIIHLKHKTILVENEKDKNTITEKLVLDEMRIPISSEREVIVIKNNDGKYETKQVSKNLVKHYMKYEGKISTSLFVDGINAGISENIMMDLIKYLSFDVDFQRDLRKGDIYEILFETYYTEEGEKVKDGNILFASLQLRNQKIVLYRYQTESGFDIYFDENGRSIQKSLLRTPINAARISSGYGKRIDPILGYSRMHRGIDFAARIGTPFFAAGNGVVTMCSRGWNGGFGNYIRIKHNNNYSTEYAHISRFAKGIKVGTRVRQGQVIGYVGNTGRSTGPHLHYGVIYNGERINPARVKSTPSIKLRGNELIAFQKTKALIESYRLNTPNQHRRFK
jgi:murein DD-endopeptidase MepM/ murein hydrolase activator NlpD